MKTIEEESDNYVKSSKSFAGCRQNMDLAFKAGVEFAQRWIDAEYIPDTPKNIDGIFYSEHIVLKMKSGRLIIGYYVKANDDEFYDAARDLNSEEVTHWRPIDYK
jgi:hypothetical protein